MLAMSVSAYASQRGMSMEVVDEFWQSVTNITQVSVFDAGTSTLSTISSDRAGDLVMTNPITTSSTNTTLSQSLGTVRWFQQAATYKVTVTDGTKTLTIDDMNSTLIRFPWFPNYIGTAASLSVNDNQSITVGTDSDMVLAWNNGNDFMSWIPASDGSAFNLGTSGTTKNVDFNVFVGTALGLKIDEGVPSLIWDGGAASINTNSNFTTNINTGTSTGAVNIGSSTSGALALDTTGAMTINADDSIDMTTSGAAADIDVDAAAGSVIIDGGEAAADAVTITAPAGGVDISSAATFDIDITATGGKVLVTPSEAAAGQFKVDATGTVAGFAIVLETTNGGVQINADDASNGDITIDAADILTLTSTDVKIFDGAAAETWTVEGTADDFEATVVYTDPTADVTWTFPTGATDTLAVMGSTLVTNIPEAANSVTGGTNQLIFEGSDDAFETILTATDATADATLTLANDSGQIAYAADGGKTTLSGAGAIPITDAIVEWTTTGANAATLADGAEGQILTVVIVTDGGEGTITPDTTFTGWATVVMTDDIDQVSFMFADTTSGWIILGTSSDGTNIVAVTQ